MLRWRMLVCLVAQQRYTTWRNSMHTKEHNISYTWDSIPNSGLLAGCLPQRCCLVSKFLFANLPTTTGDHFQFTTNSHLVPFELDLQDHNPSARISTAVNDPYILLKHQASQRHSSNPLSPASQPVSSTPTRTNPTHCAEGFGRPREIVPGSEAVVSLNHQPGLPVS